MIIENVSSFALYNRKSKGCVAFLKKGPNCKLFEHGSMEFDLSATKIHGLQGLQELQSA